jgi:hypothetical protein
VSAPRFVRKLAAAMTLATAAVSHGGEVVAPARFDFRDDAPAMRGMTIGPIESGCHPGVGYGTKAFEATLDELVGWGANWVSLTPFGRVGSKAGLGVDPKFEADVRTNREAFGRAIDQAHARGLRVLVVPHLWVESGEWRATIEPGDDEAWALWEASYTRYVTAWAELAEKHHADVFAAGVELRSWVTTARAESFRSVIKSIRHAYHGVLTYSANWDDAEDTLIWNDVDLIGINAFYPLADGPNATLDAMTARASSTALSVRTLRARFRKPVYFSEVGYTTRPDPAWKPWEWPEDLDHPVVDEAAQALAMRALLTPFVDDASFPGFFVWRVYADPNDVSQEPGWGFSPRGKHAERILRSLWRKPWPGEKHARWPALAAETLGSLR